jgi:membrane fusion protein, multidrug efflux system
VPDAVPNTAVPNTNDPLNPQDAQKVSETNTFPAAPKGTVPPDAYPHADDHKGNKHHWGLWIFLLLLVALGIYLYWRHEESAKAAKAAAANQAPRAVPITTATATKGDIGVYVSTPATVTPVYTDTITARVQGEITAVRYTEGQMVKKGDPLVEIDPRPFLAQLTQMEGQLAHDQAVLDEAKIDSERYKAALARNAIPKQLLDDQEQIVLQDEGTVKNDTGQVEAVKVNIAYTHITSPIDGRVGLRLIDPGNIVQATGTTPLVVITQLQPITVLFSIDEKYLPKVQAQLKKGSKMPVDVMNADQSKKLDSGYILTIDNQVDPTTATIRLKAIFQNVNLDLFPQQLVYARLQLDTETGVTLVPTNAIQMNSNGSFVYVVNPDQSASVRVVKPGVADNNLTAVDGVNPGDVLATNGFNNLQDGSKVTVQNGNGGGNTGGANTAASGAPTGTKNSSGKRGAGASGSGAANPNGGKQN